MDITHRTLNADDLDRLDWFPGHPHDDVEAEWVDELAVAIADGYDAEQPIIIACNPDGSAMTLYNGRHRRAAALRVGADVPALLLTFDELEAVEEDNYYETEDTADAILDHWRANR